MRRAIPFIFFLGLLIGTIPPLSAQNIVFEEDFQGGSGTTPPSGWSVNVVSGNGSTDEWHFDNPGGRTFGRSISEGKFAIFDNSAYGSSSAKEVELISPVTSVSGTQYMLSFYEYFEAGFGGKGEVYFSGNGGSSWVKVYETTSTSIANPDKISEDLEQILVNDFTASMGTYDLQVKFVFSAPDADAFWWILDDVMFYDKVAKDAAALKVTNLPSGCLSDLSTNVEAAFKNLGSSNIDTLNANLLLNTGDTITEQMTFDTLSGGVLAPDSVYNYNFDTTVQLLDGQNNVKAWPSDPDFVNDEFPANDTTYAKTTVNRLVVADLPFHDSFEDTLAFGDGWCPRLGPSGNGRVAVLPSDSIQACDGNNMAVLDAPDGSSVDKLDLLADLSSCVNKELSFTYGFMNDAADPADSLLLSVDGGGTFHPIYNLDNSLANDSCVRVTLDLDSVAAAKGIALTSNSILRWRHAGNDDVVSGNDGFYLDDVDLVLASASAGDLKMLSIENPNGGSGTDTVDVRVRFSNAGTDTIVSADMSYQYGSEAIVEEFWGGCLESGDTTTFTFSTALSRDTSTEELCAWSAQPNGMGDPNNANDSTCLSDTTSDLYPSSDRSARMELYPNPGDERFILKYRVSEPEQVPAKIRILDLAGRTVKSFDRSSVQDTKGRTELSLEGIKGGMYLIRVLDKRGRDLGTIRAVVQ